MEKTNFCQCNDPYHANNPYAGVCNARISKDYATCYFCYMGHQIPDRDNDPNDGNDEIGFRKGEEV